MLVVVLLLVVEEVVEEVVAEVVLEVVEVDREVVVAVMVLLLEEVVVGQDDKNINTLYVVASIYQAFVAEFVFVPFFGEFLN